MGVAALILALILAAYWAVFGRTVVIRVSAALPRSVTDGWAQAASASTRLSRTSVQWIDSGPCELQITDTPPLNESLSIPEETIVWPEGLGEFRPEMRDPRTGARGLATTPLVFVPPQPGRYPEKWDQLEATQLATAPWAELGSGQAWILPLDQRRMKTLWISRCAPDVRPSSAALRFVSWLYGVEAQNAVIAARYYSPWSKMVDTQGVRPWRELEIIPLAIHLPQ